MRQCGAVLRTGLIRGAPRVYRALLHKAEVKSRSFDFAQDRLFDFALRATLRMTSWLEEKPEPPMITSRRGQR